MSKDNVAARVTIHTTDFLIEGRVHTAGKAQGHRKRLSDVLNEPSPFVVLTDVDLTHLAAGGEKTDPNHYETFILRKDEIIFALPLD